MLRNERRLGAHVTLALAVLLVAVPTAMVLVAAPRFGGYDSYYFLLYANDLAQSAAETSPARYFYFPGSYEFWRAVAMVAGRHFMAYQFVFAAVAIANAALTALIVRKAGAGALLAAAGYCGYFAFARRLELGIMTTEPLATLATLLGLLVWLVCAKRGSDRLGYLLLGAGYGLAVYTKQQGAFLALGAIGLAPVLWGRRRTLSEGAIDGATVVATALGVFAIGMALDGGGLAAVKTGITSAAGYHDEGHLALHLAILAWRAPLFIAAFAVAACLWPFAWAIERRRQTSDRFWQIGVWGLGAATAAATLLQFSKRGYAHYALLTVPFALIAILPAVQWVLDRARPSIVLPALVVISGVLGAEALALPPEPGFPRHELFAGACEGIRPGERLLLLPSRENALHWACGTHARGTRWGYAFSSQERPEEYIEELAKPELTQVFVFNSDIPQSYEQEVARRHDWSGFFAALERQGFEPVTRSAAGTLYRRGAAAGADRR